MARRVAMRRSDGDIGVYLLLTLLFSGVFWGLIIAAGQLRAAGGHYVEALMWCPALAAAATVAWRKLPWRSLGFKWPANRYVGLAYLLPLAYAFAAYLLVWILGLGVFPDRTATTAIAAKMGWSISSPLLLTVVYFVFIAGIGMIRGVSSALGEEIGWRGFLAPRLYQRLGFTGSALVTGVIWTAWHVPLLLFADYNSGTPAWFALPCFAVLVMSDSFILAWLRLRSNSVWPCAIFHASHNLFIQGFFTPLTGAKGDATRFAVDEFGWAVPLAVTLFAVGAWMAWRRGSRGQVAPSIAPT
jgi:membrane protease YdiL (CAAX protease family)